MLSYCCCQRPVWPPRYSHESITQGWKLISPISQRTILQWSSFECIENPDIVTYHKCFIVNPAKTIITGEIEYNRDFQQYNAKIALSLPRRPFKDYYKYVDLTLDICQFFSGAYKNNLIKVVYNSMLKHSNMPKKCPQPKVSNIRD